MQTNKHIHTYTHVNKQHIETRKQTKTHASKQTNKQTNKQTSTHTQ